MTGAAAIVQTRKRVAWWRQTFRWWVQSPHAAMMGREVIPPLGSWDSVSLALFRLHLEASPRVEPEDQPQGDEASEALGQLSCVTSELTVGGGCLPQSRARAGPWEGTVTRCLVSVISLTPMSQYFVESDCV